MSKTIELKEHQKLDDSEFCNSRNMPLGIGRIFSLTQKGKYALRKEALDFFLENHANVLLEKVFLKLAWETGGRVNELVKASRSDLNGNVITLRYNKKGRKKKGMKKGQYEVIEKRLVLSDDTITTLKAYLKTHDDDRIIPFSDRHMRSLCKKFHKDLTPHCFRRGLGSWLYSQGASEAIIYGRLGQEDNRSLRYYLPSRTQKANEFMMRIFNGEDTRIVSDLTVDEFKNIFNSMIKE